MSHNRNLGLYASSWFGVPTASSQCLQASQANLGPYRRGAGTIFFPGPSLSASISSALKSLCAGPITATPTLGSLGQDDTLAPSIGPLPTMEFDPNLALLGLGALAAYFLLRKTKSSVGDYTEKRRRRKRARARRKAQIAALKDELRWL